MHTILRFACFSMLAAAPLAAGSIPSARPEDVGLSSERLGRIRETVQRHIDAGNVTGAVTLVARKGRIAHFEAQADLLHHAGGSGPFPIGCDFENGVVTRFLST
jgi:CubicO group peptidase (beta-lactamase class C family)